MSECKHIGTKFCSECGQDMRGLNLDMKWPGPQICWFQKSNPDAQSSITHLTIREIVGHMASKIASEGRIHELLLSCTIPPPGTCWTKMRDHVTGPGPLDRLPNLLYHYRNKHTVITPAELDAVLIPMRPYYVVNPIEQSSSIGKIGSSEVRTLTGWLLDYIAECKHVQAKILPL